MSLLFSAGVKTSKFSYVDINIELTDDSLDEGELFKK